MNLPHKDFEALVERAFADIPAAFRDKLLNLAITISDRPGPEAEDLDDADELLGLYVGPMRSEIQSGMLAGGSLGPKRVAPPRRPGPAAESAAAAPRVF